jgi:hypothetical protein
MVAARLDETREARLSARVSNLVDSQGVDHT